MNFLKTFKLFLTESHYSEFKYWLNNDQRAIQIYDSNRFNVNKTISFKSNIDTLIDYINEHPKKAIKIGYRENATSTTLSKEDFLKLSSLFPHLVNDKVLLIA